MNERKPVDTELLITRHLDGELSGDDASVLQQWLRADPANADRFVRRMIDHQRLHELSTVEPMVLAAEDLELIDAPLGGVHSPNEDSGEVLRDLLALEQGQEATQPVDITQRVLEERLAQRRAKSLQQQRRRANVDSMGSARAFVIPKSVVWLSAAAVLGLLASVVWLSQPKQTTTTTPPPTAQRDTTPRAQQRTNPAAPVQVATVTGALDARFVDGRAVTPGVQVYNAPFDLAQGIVQLELTSGVTLTLEGPARLDLGTDMFVSLDAGKLVGLVPDGAHGFVVRTPTMDVVDLGTEFGIEVDAQRGSRVHVIDGSVRLEPGRYAQDFEPQVVEAGASGRVADAGVLTPIDAEPSAFYRAVPTAYERMVRDAEPLAYWRFSSQDAVGHLAGLGLSQAALSADRAVDLRQDTPLVDDPGGRALWLGAQPRSIHTEQAIALDTSNGFTLEAWVWVPSDSDRRMRIMTNTEQNQDGHIVSGYGLAVSAAPVDRLRGQPVLMLTGYTVFDAFSQSPVPTDRWVHVSASLDERGAVWMTIDGQRVSHRIRKGENYLERNGINDQFWVRPSDGPTRIGDATATLSEIIEHWTGGIDEVAVYDRVLDMATLAAHARQGATQPTRTTPPAR